MRRRACPRHRARRRGPGCGRFLGEAGIGERGEHGVLRGGLLAGAVVARVVGVEAVDDVRDPTRGALALEDGEELVLAVEAAGGVVARVVFARELSGSDSDERDGLRSGEGDGLAQVAARARAESAMMASMPPPRAAWTACAR